MTTLPLQDRMSFSTSYSSEQRHRTVEFGDGYIQRTPLGLNNVRRQLDVTHENISDTEADTLIAFYELRQRDGDYIEIAANPLLRSAGKYYLQGFAVSSPSPNVATVTATFIEVFDP